MPTFETPEPITATIDVVVGDVRLTAGDRRAAIVDVQPSDASDEEDRRAAELTRVEYDDGRLLVKAPKLASLLSRRRGGSVDVTVELPAGSNLHGSFQVADLHSDGALGDCRITSGIGQIALDRCARLTVKSGSGDIAVNTATGHAEVNAGSGDVRLHELGSTAVVKNSNGETWVGAATGELRVRAANGAIAVDLAQAGVDAKSSNGDIRVGDAARGALALETSLGEIEVGIREGVAAWLDVNAAGGRVHNALEPSEAPEPSAETVEVRARTSLGDVVIRRPAG